MASSYVSQTGCSEVVVLPESCHALGTINDCRPLAMKDRIGSEERKKSGSSCHILVLWHIIIQFASFFSLKLLFAVIFGQL